MDKDKWLIKNWRLFSLLNIHPKLASRVFAEHLKTVLPFVISSNQTAYLNSKFIRKGGSLICDIFEVSNFLKLKKRLITVDIEKTFDSLNLNFLLKVPENYGFSQNFLWWISILLQNQESCVINGGKTMRYYAGMETLVL